MATREEILAALKPKSVTVELADFGTSAVVRMLSVGERDALLEAQQKRKDASVGASLAMIVQFTTVDQTDARLFPDGEAGFAAAMALPAKALDGLAKVAMKLNGLSDDAAESAEKN